MIALVSIGCDHQILIAFGYCTEIYNAHRLILECYWKLVCIFWWLSSQMNPRYHGVGTRKWWFCLTKELAQGNDDCAWNSWCF